MDKTDSAVVITLKNGGTLKLDPHGGTMIRVLDGSIWLTQQHDTTDYIMRSGDDIVLSGTGLTLIQAYEDSSLQFAAPDIRHGM